HVRRGAAGKPDRPHTTSGNQCSVGLCTSPEFAHEKIDGNDHESRVKRRWHARGAVADSENAVTDHPLAIIESRLFQAWFSLQSRSDPVMPVEHFARDLRISRLIGAKQTEGAESIEEKEPAERNKQQHVSPRSRTHVNQAGRGRTSAQML